MIDQNTEFGSWGTLRVGDHLHVALRDGTVVIGDLTQVNPKKIENEYTGGLYVGPYFVGFEKINFIRVISRPSPAQLFIAEVASTLSNMLGTNSRKSYLKEDYQHAASRVIDMVRKHDAENAERSVGAPYAKSSEPTPQVENQHTMRARPPVPEAPPVTERATPAHWDNPDYPQEVGREPRRVIDIG